MTQMTIPQMEIALFNAGQLLLLLNCPVEEYIKVSRQLETLYTMSARIASTHTANIFLDYVPSYTYVLEDAHRMIDAELKKIDDDFHH